ncbi:MAG: ROK family transcriptional regulator [Anaerolineaceae bacterium]
MDYQNFSDLSFIREIHLSIILRQIHNQSPLSRTQLANLTNLNKSTVSNLIDELIERGLVNETGQEESLIGRPTALLEIDPGAGGIIGVEFGVDFVAVILTDFIGTTLWRQRQEADPTEAQEATIDQTLNIVDEAIALAKSNGLRLLGLGISTPGTVDTQEGLLISAPNLHWRNVPLGKIFSNHTSLPIYIDNDANAAALGEHLFGVARQVNSFICIYAGVGVGGGLFLNGELYRGVGGFAGEIGHCTFISETFQPPCHCGKSGCWETYANQYSVIERVRTCLEEKRNSLIPIIMAEKNSPLSFQIIVDAADAGDNEAGEALAEAGSALGIGIANLINIFNPQMIVIGGPMSIAGKYFMTALEESVKKRALDDNLANTDILLSNFGANASLIGAVSLVIQAVIANPSHVERIK